MGIRGKGGSNLDGAMVRMERLGRMSSLRALRLYDSTTTHNVAATPRRDVWRVCFIMGDACRDRSQSVF